MWEISTKQYIPISNMHDDSMIIYFKKTPKLHPPQYYEVICTVQSLKTPFFLKYLIFQSKLKYSSLLVFRCTT